METSTNPPANLLGIKIVYCDNGVQKEEWVDLQKVCAISWCDGELSKKGKGNGNPNGPKLPKGKAPGPCPPGGATGGGAPLCWWDGTQWVCGETQ